MNGEPQRLLESDDAPSALRDLLRAGQRDVPSDADLSRLEGRLASILVVPAVGSVAPPSSGGAAVGTSTAKIVGAVVVAAALVGGGTWVATRAHRSAPAPVAQAPAMPVVAAPNAAEPAVVPAPVDISPSTKTNEVTPKSAKTAAERGPSEAELLEQARAALSSDPKRALALVQEHKRRFPTGALAQEREVIAIEALARLDDKQEAQKRAKEFEDRYPDSAHRRKVESVTNER